MSRSSSESSWSKRKSLFALTALRSPDGEKGGTEQPKMLKKPRHGRTPSGIFADPESAHADEAARSTPSPSEQLRSQMQRPSLGIKKRSSTSKDSLKHGLWTSTGEVGPAAGEPLSATSTTSTAPSMSWENSMGGIAPSRTVLLHGEVQTSAGMFRKKKEYLVLTETHIIRFKSQARASEVFKVIPPAGRSPSIKHGAAPSVGSQSDLQTHSDSSGEKDGRVPLRQVVATHRLDDGKPYFAIEVCYLDEESGLASAMTLQFGNPEERDYWLRCVRHAANDVRNRASAEISPLNLENAARIIEREHDYDPANCAIYKVVQRQPAYKSSTRSSSDDLTKVASVICFLAIGVHKLHLIQLVKPVARSASPALTPGGTQASHGILTLSAIKVSGNDDTFELVFRQPLQKAKTLYLASTAAYQIAVRLHFAENYLRPACGQRLFKYSAPQEVNDLLEPPVPPEEAENMSLERTLIAYCLAYGVNPNNIRYAINHDCEDAPRFELLRPSDGRRPNYGPLELLAIMRALRYNESFGSISFARIHLDSLNGIHDNYGQEMVCWRTKRGTAIKVSAEELARSCLLVQEIRALAATSKRLRRLDFSGCITARSTVPDPSVDEPAKVKEIGCGIVEALFPLCRYQTTNVDWICLNGIELCETDLDYLVGTAVDKSCHFRAIELNRCGLSDRSMGLILDALRAQENTLECLEIAGNTARLNPATFDSQLGFFGFIRRLNLSNVSMTSGPEPFLQAETLLMWRLQELRMSGTSINIMTIKSLATYLADPQSDSLRQLHLDNASLSGSEVAILLYAVAWEEGKVRDMHFDISQSKLSIGLDKMVEAIRTGQTPAHLTMRAIEYKEESSFRKMIGAVATNKKLRYLDMSQTALPGDASDETCRAIERLLVENDTLVELDISGDDSRLATSKFGPGFPQALGGLKKNKTLKVLRVSKQKIRLPGASILAEVLRENRTLIELHCDDNEIPLHGLTDLVNALIDNTVLCHLPQMHDGRAAAFRDAEATMKVMSDTESPSAPKEPKPSPSNSGSMMRRGFASVRKTAQRSASSAPSFPALSSYGRNSPSPGSRSGPSANLVLPPTVKARQASLGPGASPLSSFTVQDVQTTHRLLTEQWDRQCYRLAQYLERNWCMLHSIPCNMEIEDEKFERPDSVSSIGKMLEQVKYDTTPRAEKDIYFDSPQDVNAPDYLPTERPSPAKRGDLKHSVSFKQFLLASSGPPTPELPDDDDDFGSAALRQLRIDTNMEHYSEPKTPKTPTQKAFTANV